MENCNHPIQGSLSVHLPTVIIANLHTNYQEITMNTSADGVLCLLRVIQFILGASKLLGIYLLLTVFWFGLFMLHPVLWSFFLFFLTFTCRVPLDSLFAHDTLLHSHGALTHLVCYNSTAVRISYLGHRKLRRLLKISWELERFI